MDALVPQFSSLTIEQITEAFAKQVVSTAKINITAVIRENLPMWESKLFPVIGAYEISTYEVLADILVAAGCRSAEMNQVERARFVNLIAKAVRAVKVQRGELTAAQKRAAARSSVPAELLQPRTRANQSAQLTAGRITTAIDISQGSALPPSSVASGVKDQGGSNGPAVVSEPMAVSKTPVSVPAAVGGFSFKTALDRLRSEPPGSAWSPEDDELHAAFLSLCNERGAGSIKNLTHYLKPNENSKRDCFVQFLAKVDRTKKVI